jgi:hypothetical protein
VADRDVVADRDEVGLTPEGVDVAAEQLEPRSDPRPAGAEIGGRVAVEGDGLA